VLHQYSKLQVGWRHNAVEKRKLEIVESVKEQQISSGEIKKYLDDHADKFQCQKCNKKYHPNSNYQLFSTSPSTCTNVLICKRVHVPNLDIPKHDINFREIREKDEFYICPESCCYGMHCSFVTSVGSISRYQECG